jgi:hypothetical protein
MTKIFSLMDVAINGVMTVSPSISMATWRRASKRLPGIVDDVGLRPFGLYV